MPPSPTKKAGPSSSNPAHPEARRVLTTECASLSHISTYISRISPENPILSVPLLKYTPAKCPWRGWPHNGDGGRLVKAMRWSSKKLSLMVSEQGMFSSDSTGKHRQWAGPGQFPTLCHNPTWGQITNAEIPRLINTIVQSGTSVSKAVSVVGGCPVLHVAAALALKHNMYMSHCAHHSGPQHQEHRLPDPDSRSLYALSCSVFGCTYRVVCSYGNVMV